MQIICHCLKPKRIILEENKIWIHFNSLQAAQLTSDPDTPADILEGLVRDKLQELDQAELNEMFV